nr:hypothetical protein [Tanacetum cinerariifolium]
MTDVHTTQVLEDTHVTLTLVNPDGQQQSSSVSSQFVTSMFNPSPDADVVMMRIKMKNPLLDQIEGPREEEKEKSQGQQVLQRKRHPRPLTLPATHGSIQPWISDLDKQVDSHASFNEMDIPVDFSAFLMNRLNVDTLTPKLLAGPTYELMKGSCKSRVELEFFLEEVYKLTTDQLDWNNPRGQQYPHNLLKPLPLIPNSRGRRVIPFDHFINNDVEYLRGGASSRKYTTSVTKTKAADYGHIKWIEDLVPRTMWSQAPVSYDKYALWGISHWGANVNSSMDLRSTRSLLKMSTLNEGDLKRLCIQDIEDMLLLLVQGKLTNLTVKERFSFNVSLRMFTRSIIIQRRVKDLQLGVESYQKKLNLTNPNTYKFDLKRKEAYTSYSNPRGFIYQNKDKQNRLMHIDELHKFSDDTLNDVRTTLDDHLKGIRMKKIHTLAGNPVKEILLKLNLPDHRTLKDGGEGTCFQLSQRFIAACSEATIKYKDIMKAQVHVSRLPLL